MRIAKIIPIVAITGFFLLLVGSSVSPSGGKLGTQNKYIFLKALFMLAPNVSVTPFLNTDQVFDWAN